MSGISRRLLMRGGAAAGLLAMAAGAQGATAQATGTLRLGLPALPEGFGGAGWTGLPAEVLGAGCVFDTLTAITARGELVGELATGWRSDADGRRWVLTLRESVAFHDGTRLAAEDVVASLVAARDGAGAGLLADVTAVEARRGEVVLTLAAANPELPFLLSDPALVIAPGGDVASGIGTGPYAVHAADPGRRMLLERSDRAWHPAGDGFARVDALAIPDPAERVAALRAGRIDAAPLDPAQAGEARQMRGVRVVQATGNRYVLLECRDPALARVFAHAIDRPAMVRDGLAGLGRVAADCPVEAGVEAVCHDGFRARALAAKSLAGADLALAVAPGVPEAVTRQVSLAARDAGLRLIPATEGGADLVLSLPSGRMTADWTLAADHGAGPFGDALRAMRMANDRPAAYVALAARLAEEGTVVIPAFADWIFAHSVRIAPGGPVGARFDLDDGRIARRWRPA
ncbi:ABC transporter substrate-binding protein [Wenxinia marina]|uniref:Bacterial extracellular solute-binding protein, family 5 Middle n=1 Tax=Wenxinia marina DSM 24838 TaxID=1123501 RepID=A0A0D0PI02_9RHOB|nr:ABC transporter substrate-binding protein [Wenxinia marina]KIQ71016.1 Bacterial extracellular solute-binding protein, family 5 Middle [Wenxinia marina DSM 24838]GGL55541.1 tRNA-dihydrouridine synthase A [Wenxinia marina]